jgi:predicted ribosome-associated RNA-binding protein Tma20
MINNTNDIIQSDFFNSYIKEHFTEIKYWIEEQERIQVELNKREEERIKKQEAIFKNKELMPKLYPSIIPTLWDHVTVEIKENDKNFSIHRTNDEYIVLKAIDGEELDELIKDERDYDWIDIVVVKYGILEYLNKFLKYDSLKEKSTEEQLKDPIKKDDIIVKESRDEKISKLISDFVKSKEEKKTKIKDKKLSKEELLELYPSVSPILWEQINVDILEKDKNFSVYKSGDKFLIFKEEDDKNIYLRYLQEHKYDWVDVLIVKNGKITYQNKFLQI